MKWYEHKNPRTGEHFWWTQRYGKSGTCFQIDMPSPQKFVLSVCDKSEGTYPSLQAAMDSAETIRIRIPV